MTGSHETGCGDGGTHPRAAHLEDGAQADARTETKAKPRRPQLTVRLCDSGATLTLKGRVAQTLEALMDRGDGGATSGDLSPLGWARRTSAYVHRLRHVFGLAIATRRERHGDASVGRYRLETALDRIEPEGAP
jgi:hypothetical protein